MMHIKKADYDTYIDGGKKKYIKNPKKSRHHVKQLSKHIDMNSLDSLDDLNDLYDDEQRRR